MSIINKLKTKYTTPIHAFITKISPERIIGTLTFEDMHELSLILASNNTYDDGTNFQNFTTVDFVKKATFKTSELNEVLNELEQASIPTTQIS